MGGRIYEPTPGSLLQGTGGIRTGLETGWRGGPAENRQLARDAGAAYSKTIQNRNF